MARPSKLTLEAQATIVRALRALAQSGRRARAAIQLIDRQPVA